MTKKGFLALAIGVGLLLLALMLPGCGPGPTVVEEPEEIVAYDSVVVSFADLADGVAPDTVELYGEWLNYDTNAIELDPFYFSLEYRDATYPAWQTIYTDYYFESTITFGGTYTPGVWFELRWNVYTINRERNDTTFMGDYATLLWEPPEIE